MKKIKISLISHLSLAIFFGIATTACGDNITPTTSATQTLLTKPVYHAFGDSFSTIDSNGASPASDGYVQLISNDFVTTLTDYAVGNSQCADVNNGQIFANENPNSPFSSLYTLMIGTNDANGKGVGTYENGVFIPCHEAMIAWLAIPQPYKIFGQAKGNIRTGTWVNDNTYQTGIGLKSTTNGTALAIPIVTTGGPLYVWYRVIDGNGGTFTYSLDGGTPISVNGFTTPAIGTANKCIQGVALIRISSVLAGSHLLTFVVTSETGPGNVISILGVGTVRVVPHYRSPKVFVGGVIRQEYDSNSAATAAYDADVQTSVNLLHDDGLSVYFVPVRNYVNATTDMIGAVAPPLHPNNAGHSHLRDAFEAIIQFIP